MNRHYSASQVQLYRSNPAKWRDIYLYGMDRDPPTESMRLGTEWHEQLAHYWDNTGWITEPRLREIPGLLSRFVGVSARNVETQIDTELTRFPGAGWRGGVDLWQYRDGHLEILDYKTLGSPDRERAPEQLAVDVQMISYAFWVTTLLITDCQPYPPDKITLTHCYIMRTGKPMAWCSSVEVTWDHVLVQWCEIMKTVELMEKERDLLPSVEVADPSVTTLYINCTPHNQTITTLEQWLTPVIEQVEQANSKPWQLMEFRTGSAAINALLKQQPAPDHLVVNTSSEVWPLVSTQVIARYSGVVVGLR